MHPECLPRVYETHPEVAFWRLNGEQPLSQPKKRKNRVYQPGLELRRQLLSLAGLPDDVIYGRPPIGASEDDLIDALACAVIARRIFERSAKPFPDPPPYDEFDLPMAIWA